MDDRLLAALIRRAGVLISTGVDSVPTEQGSPAFAPPPAPQPRSRRRWPILLAALAVFAVLALLLALGLSRTASPPLPVFGTLPAFRFTSEQGRDFGSAQLEGKVWIANFIFTRCPTICPRFSSQMAQVQRRTAGEGDRLHLVSFSVDPDYDRPPVLAEYARRYHADPDRWTFLTGDPKQIERTVVDGFKQTMARDPSIAAAGGQDFMSIVHGTRFVLVDSQLRIRGYYDSGSPEEIEALVRDAQALAREPP